MAVNIIYSLTNGGAAITELVDHGSASNGQETAGKTIFIRHDGNNEITNAGYYIRALSTPYSGSATAIADISEILSWADSGDEDSFGGFIIDQKAPDFDSTIPTFDIPKPTNPGDASEVFRTGAGNSDINLINVLPASDGGTGLGVSAEGTIEPGDSTNVRFKVYIKVPTNEDSLGVRQFDQVLKYDFTS